MDALDTFLDVVRAGDISVIKHVLSTNPEFAITTNANGSALHFCSRKDIAELLLNHGARVDARDDRGDTPLHVAAHWNCVEVAEVLLDHGADIEATGKYSLTPLFEAATSRENCDEMVHFLLSRGAQVTLDCAVVLGDAERVRSIIARNPDAIVGSNRKHRLVFDAVFESHMRLIKADAGSEEATTEDMITKLTPLLDVLVLNGADINGDAKGSIPSVLMYAITEDIPELVALLALKGVDLLAREPSGKSAMDLAKSDEVRAVLESQSG